MRIPENIVKKITLEADIVAIIGEHVKLEKKGNDYKGICPFHNDTNPSMSVSPSKNVFKCFSCGAAGNAISFIQRYKNLNFPQAIKYVGERMGIDVEFEDDEKSQNFQKYYKILLDAANYYEFYLKNTKDGSLALEYLYKRKINDEIIKRFKIGLSSNEANLLYKTFTQKENPVLPIDLINVNLIRASETGNYFDVFTNRIMFPISDNDGNVVGFSGRIYKDKKNNESKYINSSESDIFKKNNILYNFHSAYNNIKMQDKVFVFEGFMDVIAAFKANVLNAIATMGTALTKNHISAIKRATNNVVICFDGDSAGISASQKAIRLLVEEGLNVKALLLPEGLDPDEYLDKYGSDKLHEFLENESVSAVEFLYQIAKRSLDINDAYSIENFKEKVLSFLKMFNSNSLAEIYIKRLSDDLKVEVKNLTKDFENLEKTPYIIRKEDTIKVKKNSTSLRDKYVLSETHLVYYAYYSKSDCLKIFNPKYDYVGIYSINREILYKLFDYYKTHEIVNQDLTNDFSEEEKDTLNYIIESITPRTVIPIDKCLEVIALYPYQRTVEGFHQKKNRGDIISEKDEEEFIKAKQKIVVYSKNNKN